MTYRWQGQPGPLLCTPTSISILTGISVPELLSDVGGGDRAYTIDEFMTPLLRRGWMLAPAYSSYHLNDEDVDLPSELILTTCPSVVSGILLDSEVPEGTNKYHAVAWTGNYVLDPGSTPKDRLSKIFKTIMGVSPILPIPMYNQYWTNKQSEVPDWL